MPKCSDKECGDDGCGGTCGKCPASAPSCEAGLCKASCTPNCAGKECGDDGCGGTCGKCPASAPSCEAGLCKATCTPQCVGKQCGSDGCGGFCGTCPASAPLCGAAGQCVAPPNPCGNGTCDVGETQLTCPADCKPACTQSGVGACDDGDSCTKDTCTATGCKFAAVNCDDSNGCTNDSCDPSVGCQHKPNALPCSDNDACTVNDICGMGQCKGEAKICDDGNSCTDETCTGGKCASAPVAGAPSCGPVQVCKSGTCVVDATKQPVVKLKSHRLEMLSAPSLFGFIHHLYGKVLGPGFGDTWEQDLLELEVKNPGGIATQVTLEVKIPGYSEVWSKTLLMQPNTSEVVAVPKLSLNSNWQALAAKVSTQIQFQVSQAGSVVYSDSLTIDLYPRNQVYWGMFNAFDWSFSGQEAVVTLATPASPIIGQLLAVAKNYSIFGSMVGYQCTSGYAWGSGSLQPITVTLKPGEYQTWSTWYAAGELVPLNITASCNWCSSTNAQYTLEDGDGSILWETWALGSATKLVLIDKDGWYTHIAENPASNSSPRTFTIKRPVSASECAADQLSAIYKALQASGFGYTTVGAFSGTQYVKPIEKTWQDKAGNCIDGTILFAAALEAMDMRPMIVMPPEHAFVATFVSDQGSGVIPIETTAIGNGVSPQGAINLAIESYNAKPGSTTYIDVMKQRSYGFAPLP